MPYERATGLSSAIERGATMVGAAIAGGLVATVGAANAVAVDAVSFGVCALLLLVTTRSLEPARVEAASEPDRRRDAHVVRRGAARRLELPAPRRGPDEPVP